MEIIKCDYCGRDYDASFATTLENGSPACPDCVEKEEKDKEKREDTQKEK